MAGSSVVLFLILLVWHVFQKESAAIVKGGGIHRFVIVWFGGEDKIFLWGDQIYF